MRAALSARCPRDSAPPINKAVSFPYISIISGIRSKVIPPAGAIVIGFRDPSLLRDKSAIYKNCSAVNENRPPIFGNIEISAPANLIKVPKTIP